MENKKILIIGISGTGKTTLTKKLSALFGLPVYHLDKFIWKENWVEATQDELTENVKNVISKNEWIIEGWISPLAKEKIEAADYVIYLDYSGVRALLGGIKRWWQNKGRVREEMPAGCVEKLDLKYLLVILKRKERQEIEDSIKQFENKITRIKHLSELEVVLEKVQ